MLLSTPVVSLTFAVGNSIEYCGSVITEYKLLLFVESGASLPQHDKQENYRFQKR